MWMCGCVCVFRIHAAVCMYSYDNIGTPIHSVFLYLFNSVKCHLCQSTLV